MTRGPVLIVEMAVLADIILSNHPNLIKLPEKHQVYVSAIGRPVAAGRLGSVESTTGIPQGTVTQRRPFSAIA